MKDKKNIADSSTEEKIKSAARKIFIKKGYAATRTRDITAEAGINTALLNYYFRSKEKLFEIIMIESLTRFTRHMSAIFNDAETSFEEKIRLIAEGYTDFLIEEPELPLFILSESRSDPERFFDRHPFGDMIQGSVFIRQYEKEMKEGRVRAGNPFHLVMNLMSLVVFPFAASTMMKSVGKLDEEGFVELLQARKVLIPQWIDSMIRP